MHTESRFSEVTDSLRNGFLADSVILAIAKVNRSGVVSDPEREVFNEAVSVLDSAMKGHQWLEDPQITATARSYANFFAQAMKALPEVQTSESFIENLGALKETALQLAQGEGVPPADRLQQLRIFFFNTAEAALERTEKLLEGENAAEALKWTVSTE